MLSREKHTEGFTLAELLMTIAIILVLAAIAIPSIITAQNNMRMVELNNAAESLANAAQTQMTAKKVSGTWFELVEQTGTDGITTDVYPQAINLPTDVSADDTYFMTAAQARQSNILSGLAIDDTVLNGDYIIEFTKSTANVISVFYTDGKSGFFDTAPQGGNGAAAAYYQARGSREQEDRRLNSPMIGYYQGTPASATNAVALKNPVISVNKGKLLVQDSNLTTTQSAGTTMDITIQKKDGSNAFKISGLSKNSKSYVVSKADGTSECKYLNTGEDTIYKLIDKPSQTSDENEDDVQSSSSNVYSIDLSKLVKILSKNTAAASLYTIVNAYAPADEVQVDAFTTLSGPSIPAQAKAFIQWPTKVAKITVLVTNPALDADREGKVATSHIGGTYTTPEVKLVTRDGADVDSSIIPMEEEKESIDIKSETPKLVEENPEAGRQAYSGKSVGLQNAYDKDANVEITSGSYTANGSTINTSTITPAGNTSMGEMVSSTKTHQYQIYEIWINEQRVGYLNQGEWIWEGALGDIFKGVITIPEDVSDMTSLTIDTRALYGSEIEADDEGYSIYVRTTPRASEVEAYFSGIGDNGENNGMVEKLASYLGWLNKGTEKAYGTTGSRGLNRGAPVRQPFENEFGASSTVALWNMTTSFENNYTFQTADGSRFPWYGDLRIYYSATPAVAWGDKNYTTYSIYNALPSALLWFYDKTDDGSYVKEPQAYVRDARSGTAANLKLVKSYYNQEVTADFEIEYNKDYLFYRVIEYCDEDGNPIADTDLQYVPFSVQSDEAYARIAAASVAPSKNGSRFIGWNVSGEYMWPKTSDGSMQIAAGDLVSRYDETLGYGYVKLTAQYKELPTSAGLMYLEFDGDKLCGYYGYLSGEDTSETKDLTRTDTISTWGYYAVVPQGAAAPVAENGSLALTGETKDVVIDEVTYTAYRLASGTDTQKKANQTASYTTSKNGETETSTYTINLNFAAAVAREGGNPQTAITTNANNEKVSAWNVRHADQFIGSLQGSNSYQGEQIIKLYVNDNYLQTCNIDMSQRSLQSGVFSNDSNGSVFSGIYDGGNHRIWNAHVNSINSKRVQISGEPQSMRGSSLLFPRVSGVVGDDGTAKKACLKNIQMFEDLSAAKNDTHSWIWTNDDSSANVGLLAGTISHAVVENCSIEGISSSKDSLATISIVQKGNNVAGWSLLVGFAKDSSLINLKASNIKLVASLTNEASVWGQNVRFGSIVSHVENSPLVACNVNNVEIGTTSLAHHPSPNQIRTLYGGGLVGDFEGTLTLDRCEVNSAVLVAHPDQNTENNKLSVGGLVGKELAPGFDTKGSTASDIKLKQGDTTTVVVEPTVDKPVDPPTDPGTEDGRKEDEEGTPPLPPTITDPVDPIDPADPLNPPDSTDPTDPPEPTDPSAPTEPDVEQPPEGTDVEQPSVDVPPSPDEAGGETS